MNRRYDKPVGANIMSKHNIVFVDSDDDCIETDINDEIESNEPSIPEDIIANKIGDQFTIISFDIWKYIILYISLGDLSSLRKVCKYFNQLTRRDITILDPKYVFVTSFGIGKMLPLLTQFTSYITMSYDKNDDFSHLVLPPTLRQCKLSPDIDFNNEDLNELQMLQLRINMSRLASHIKNILPSIEHVNVFGAPNKLNNFIFEIRGKIMRTSSYAPIIFTYTPQVREYKFIFASSGYDFRGIICTNEKIVSTNNEPIYIYFENCDKVVLTCELLNKFQCSSLYVYVRRHTPVIVATKVIKDPNEINQQYKFVNIVYYDGFSNNGSNLDSLATVK